MNDALQDNRPPLKGRAHSGRKRARARTGAHRECGISGEVDGISAGMLQWTMPHAGKRHAEATGSNRRNVKIKKTPGSGAASGANSQPFYR
jgi:hypothetical protein